MSESFERLKSALKKLPGLGNRSAERIALHLCVENPAEARALLAAAEDALRVISPCPVCGNVSENGARCPICADSTRIAGLVCVIERASDIGAIERSGAWRGRYHVLGGKLSPLKRVGPDELNLRAFAKRLADGEISEVILALSNDIEGEATCHYIQERIIGALPIKITRIGFGLPSGSQLGFADPNTIKSALEARKTLH